MEGVGRHRVAASDDLSWWSWVCCKKRRKKEEGKEKKKGRRKKDAKEMEKRWRGTALIGHTAGRGRSSLQAFRHSGTSISRHPGTKATRRLLTLFTSGHFVPPTALTCTTSLWLHSIFLQSSFPPPSSNLSESLIIQPPIFPSNLIHSVLPISLPSYLARSSSLQHPPRL